MRALCAVKRGAVVMVIIVFTFSVSLVTRQWAILANTAPNLAIVLSLSNEKFDFIDLPGVTGGVQDTYFGGHELWLDGQRLQRIKDYRILPAANGI